MGIEDFIQEVKEIRAMCSEKALLLKAIKVEKIIGQVAKSIRNIPLHSYVELYNALSQNVASQATLFSGSDRSR